MSMMMIVLATGVVIQSSKGETQDCSAGPNCVVSAIRGSSANEQANVYIFTVGFSFLSTGSVYVQSLLVFLQLRHCGLSREQPVCEDLKVSTLYRRRCGCKAGGLSLQIHLSLTTVITLRQFNHDQYGRNEYTIRADEASIINSVCHSIITASSLA